MNADRLELTLSRADDRTFTGIAWTGLLGSATTPEALKLYFVRFEPGARTFWHVHSGDQLLVVTEGVCRYQREGEPIAFAEAGESVRFVAGERHWHGAASDAGAVHIAVNIDSSQTDWQEEASAPS